MDRKNKRTKGIEVFRMAFMLLLATLLSVLTPVLTAHADTGLTLKLHYHREDADYAPWDVWLWPAGGDGAGYPFEEENGEMVATMEVEPGTTSVGFIVRTQDWEKDIDEDQFIDIAEMLSGTVHIYVESGVEGYTKEYGEDAVTGTKLKTAIYDGNDVVTLTFTGEMNAAQEASLYVTGRQGEVEITGIEGIGDFQYEMKLAKELNVNWSYKVGFEEMEYPLHMPNLYSTEEFEAAYTYPGDDLGAVYSAEKTSFRVWAPTADEVYLNRYEGGDAVKKDLIERIAMTADVNGTWVAEVAGDIKGTYYTFMAVTDGHQSEACDPYARTTGANGERAMVIDLAETDPEGWENDTNPHAGAGINDAVIYELHIRDFSADDSSGMEHTGKYLAFTENGTTNGNGSSTGVDYLKNLGITHVHLLPFYDFGSVNEKVTSVKQYNWGYDPVNYNVPEGSYATDPYHGEVRVAEAKQMVKALHDNGLSVIMDVVYNHVYNASDFCINRLVPGYFSRVNEDGSYSNGSGCGNDTASERSMVRKYIVDSVCYWADEYHIDGFRFDLVGLLDVDTVNEIVSEVHKTHPDVIFYGEGWTLTTTLTKKGCQLATQTNSGLTPGFAYFNDNIRDGLKGSVFNTETGYVSGASGKEGAMVNSFRAREAWSHNPSQIVSYASCHDNMTLYDRLAASRPDASNEDLIRMNNLAAAFYMTAQGVPFLQAGEELLRTKVKEDGSFDSNSYSSGDEINSIKWDTLDDPVYQKVLAYYQGLIAFRKEHSLLRLTGEEEVSDRITAVDGQSDNVLAFQMEGDMEGEVASKLFVIFNANTQETTVNLPDGSWNVYVNGEKAGTEILETLADGTAKVAPISAMVLAQEEKTADTVKTDVTETTGESGSGALPVAAVGGTVLLAGGAVLLLRKKKK